MECEGKTRATSLTVTMKLRSPVDQELLIEDLQAHVAGLIADGFTNGEVVISDADGRTVSGWWDVSFETV